MLNIFSHLFKLVWFSHKESRRERELRDDSIQVNVSVQLKNKAVRIIHAGRREEQYQNEIPASKLMEKYPGMCVARPEVFKHPHESLLLAEEKLLPGFKYYIIPFTTVQKLKRKYNQKTEGKEVLLDGKIVGDVGSDCSEDSVCSSKDFHDSGERWTRSLVKKCRRGKKLFVPPIQKPKKWRESAWEPSLNSVQEISP